MATAPRRLKPNVFADIIDQEPVIRILRAYLANGTLPHALLFAGIPGIGKKTTAQALAMAVNCLHNTPQAATDTDGRPQTPAADACGHCIACRKIANRTHPDVIRIEPENRVLRIGRIRDLCTQVAMKPYEARHRVILISDAHTMNAEAANALLKLLEEPPDCTLLILTAAERSDLLPTIVSRCQCLRFTPLDRRKLAELIAARQHLDPPAAELAATLAGGSVTKAEALTDADVVNFRRWLLTTIDQLPAQPPAVALAVAEEISKDKTAATDALELIQTYVRDLVVWRYAPKKIINLDLQAAIAHSASKVPVADLLARYEAIQKTQKEMGANVNLRLSLERLFLKLAA